MDSAAPVMDRAKRSKSPTSLPSGSVKALALAVGLFSLSLSEAQAADAAATAQSTAKQPAIVTGDKLKQSVWKRDKLTGDWGGLRSDLTKHGIDIEMRNSHYLQKVTQGGVEDNDADTEYGVLLDTFINIDASKLFGSWDGLYISTHIQSRDGSDVLADAGTFSLPNAALMFPEPGNYDGTNVTGMYATQMLFDDKAAVLAGKLNAFDLLEGFFPNGVVDYGLDGFMNANSFMSILTWGRFLTLSQYGIAGWTMAHDMPSSGFIVAGHDNTTTTWDTSDSFSDGVAIMFFHRFVWEIGGLQGYWYAAPGGSTKKYASLDPVDWTVLPGEGPVNTKKKRPWSFASYIHQVLWQHKGDANRRVFVFAGISVTDDNPAFTDWGAFANVQAFGPFDARPNDRMGLAGHYYRYADDYVDLVSDIPGENLRDDSWTFEAYYNVQLNRWLHLTPNIQYAQNEQKSDDAAVIPGLRLVIDF